MHNLSPLTPYNNNIPIPMVKKLDKFEFSLQQKLGSGMAGDVYVGINTQNAQLVCVKVIDKELFKTQTQKTMLEHQIKCQKLIQCQYTIKIFQVFDQNPFCFIITQFCEGGDLYKLLKYTPDGLPQNIVQKFGLEVARALLKLKQMQIIHRDIKPQNILLRQQVAKLGDFGFAIEEKNLQNKEQLNIGSPLYMSLEALQKNEYSYASDVFSYGIVLYEMVHKVSPWQCNDESVLKQKIRTEPVQYKAGVSQELKDLISRCLSLRPEDRITIEQIVEHVFFRPLNETVQEMKEQKLTEDA